MSRAKNMELTNAGKEMVAKIFQGLILFLFFDQCGFSAIVLHSFLIS
ncbi:MAG: hypothetical protein RLZZ408_1709 [Verrucomicrobiota bacterium]|jgi:hypothetical protein